VPVRCEVWRGIVFANLSGDAPPLAEYMRPLDELWVHIDLDALEVGATACSEFDANWKMAFDNWENYHEPFVHAGVIPLRMKRGVAEKSFDNIAEGCYGGFRSRTEVWNDQHAQSLPILPGQPREAPELFIMSIFPNTKMTLTSNHAIATVWTPLSVGRTEMKVAWMFAAEGAVGEAHEPARQKVVTSWLDVRDQDIVVWEYQQIARASPVADDVKFSPFWEAIAHRFQNQVVDGMM
jgi:choline monooxygenase